jgi:hypothetical protein
MDVDIMPLSKKMASFLLFLSCFDSYVYCKYQFQTTSSCIVHVGIYCTCMKICFILGVHCVTQAEIDQHLALGMNMLAR